MAIIYRMTTVDGRKDLDFGGPQIVVLGSGDSIPAATGFNEGDILQPHPNDGGGLTFMCQDYVGTKRWGAPGGHVNVDFSTNTTSGVTSNRFRNATIVPPVATITDVYVHSYRWQGRTDPGDGIGVDWENLLIYLDEVLQVTDNYTQGVAGGTQFNEFGRIDLILAIDALNSGNQIRINNAIGGGAPGVERYAAAIYWDWIIA